MRPVNLLPERLRPREGSRRPGVAYALLGALATVLVAVVLYVLTVNQVTSRQAETESLRAKTQAAEARAGALTSYGTFKKMAQTRLSSVQAVAAVRFDWERMSRELALVLPKGVWLTELEASGPGGEEASTGSSSSGAGGAGGSSSEAGGSSPESSGTSESGGGAPALDLTGCAPSQEAVAETMVRLRRVHQAEDVKLISSERAKEQSGSEAGSSASSDGAAAGASGTAAGCGKTGGRGNYAFSINVILGSPPAQTPESGKVPASLGGGV